MLRLDVCGRAMRLLVQLCAGEKDSALVNASSKKNLVVGQQGRRVAVPRNSHASCRCECPCDRVVKIHACARTAAGIGSASDQCLSRLQQRCRVVRSRSGHAASPLECSGCRGVQRCAREIICSESAHNEDRAVVQRRCRVRLPCLGHAARCRKGPGAWVVDLCADDGAVATVTAGDEDRSVAQQGCRVPRPRRRDGIGSGGMALAVQIFPSLGVPLANHRATPTTVPTWALGTCRRTLPPALRPTLLQPMVQVVRTVASGTLGRHPSRGVPRWTSRVWLALRPLMVVGIWTAVSLEGCHAARYARVWPAAALTGVAAPAASAAFVSRAARESFVEAQMAVAGSARSAASASPAADR